MTTELRENTSLSECPAKPVWFERLPVALQAGQIGAWEWDVGSGRLSWSPTLEEIFGIQPGTFGGRMDDLVARIHVADRSRVQATMDRAIAERTFFHCEHRVDRGGDSTAWVEVRGRVLPESADQPCVAGVCLDVTPRQSAREELDAERTRLWSLMQEHTGALQQLDRVDRLASSSMLAAEIAHETNNSLSNILMVADSALRKSGPYDFHEAFTIIRDETLRISRITRGMLDVVETECSSKTPTDLNRVVKQSLVLARRYVNSDRLTCKLDLADSLPPVSINETAIEQVIVNLIKNSYEAATEGVQVVVRTASRAGNVQLTITDDGPGIPDMRLQNIFAPFFSTKPGHGCRGLGLSLSRRIISEHGGQITVVSNPESGTVFTIELLAAK